MMLFCPNGHYNGENDDDPLGFRGKLFSAVQRGDPLRIRWAFYGFLRGLIQQNDTDKCVGDTRPGQAFANDLHILMAVFRGKIFKVAQIVIQVWLIPILSIFVPDSGGGLVVCLMAPRLKRLTVSQMSTVEAWVLVVRPVCGSVTKKPIECLHRTTKCSVLQTGLRF